MNLIRSGLLIAPIALLGVMPVSAGMVINLSFTANFNTNFGANAAAAQAAVTYAAQQFENLYTDPIHVNITVDAVAGTGVLGNSSTFLNSITYNNLRNAAIADAKSVDDQTSVGAGGSITAADPTGGAGTWWVSTAQAKALGILADNLNTDGTIKFGTGFTYTFDPNNRVVGGAIDFIGVVEHEISEVMGRIGVSGGTIGAFTPSYTLLDDLAYTGAATKGLGFVAGDFLSIDNGTTLLKQFNQVGGGDSRDWQSGTNDSFNAFSNSGVQNDLSQVDIRTMDVLGYDLAVPEPGTIILFGAGLSLIVVGRVRRKAQKS
jgi:hypothetical protein